MRTLKTALKILGAILLLCVVLLCRGDRDDLRGHAPDAGALRRVHVARAGRGDGGAAVQAAVDVGARRRAARGGDRAPDFALPLLHSDRKVTLSTEYRQKPVVLIFGSYT